MAATKKAPASGSTLTGVRAETFAGSQSDFILAQKMWDSLVKIYGAEQGLILEVKAKGEKIAV